jgi:hypothetical protein
LDEGIAAEHVDGLEAEWRQAGDVLSGLTTFSPELGRGRVHTQRVPEHDDVDHWAERAELVFPGALGQFASLAMEHGLGERVAAFATVELKVAYLDFEFAMHFGVRSRSGRPSRSSGLPL